jgi:hypothetical protein
LYEFRQGVAAGYTWLTGVRKSFRLDDAPVFVVSPVTEHRRYYRPVEEKPKLFTRFASLCSAKETDEQMDRVHRFVSSFGSLRSGTSVCLREDEDDVRLAHAVTGYRDFIVLDQPWQRLLLAWVESLDYWIGQSTIMRGVCDLLESANSGDKAHIEKVIKWSDRMIHYGHPCASCRANPPKIPWLKRQMECRCPHQPFPVAGSVAILGDDTPLAHAVAHRNWQFLAHVVIESVTNSMLSDQTSLEVHRNEDGSYKHDLVPHSLLGALWVQFMHELTGVVHYKLCPGCDEWFSVTRSAGGRTARARYCTDACHDAYHNRRKPTTRAARHPGKPSEASR